MVALHVISRRATRERDAPCHDNHRMALSLRSLGQYAPGLLRVHAVAGLPNSKQPPKVKHGRVCVGWLQTAMCKDAGRRAEPLARRVHTAWVGAAGATGAS